jgi:hypothetical protein
MSRQAVYDTADFDARPMAHGARPNNSGKRLGTAKLFRCNKIQ